MLLVAYRAGNSSESKQGHDGGKQLVYLGEAEASNFRGSTKSKLTERYKLACLNYPEGSTQHGNDDIFRRVRDGESARLAYTLTCRHLT